MCPDWLPVRQGDFTKTVIVDKMQNVYCDMKNRVPVVKSDILEYLKKYDYILEEADIDTMHILWMACNPEFPGFQEYMEDASLFEWKLMLMFMDYMTCKNVAFATAYDIRCIYYTKLSILSTRQRKFVIS